MDPRDVWVTQNAYFSLLTPTKQLLFVTLFIEMQEISQSVLQKKLEVHPPSDGPATHMDEWADGQTEGQTDVEVKIIM